MDQAELHIILAAGGTGGHIFPAEALTEELIRRGCQVSLVTDSRFSDYSAASMKGILGEIPIYPVKAGTMGRNLYQRARGALNVGLGVMQARRLLKKLKPAVVVGFGGYPSFPTMIAASNCGIPTVIHEQNSILGKANRVLAGRVSSIATSFPATGLMRKENEPKVALVGNPVRSAVRALHDVPYPELSDDGVMRILVTGGSQGANVFSQIVPKAIALLPENLRHRLRVDQQTRREDMDTTRTAYQDIQVNADLSPFFTDVPARLASAHLVISRSGASTIAELSCAGRPSILVPYPNSADDHQMANANAMEEAGAAWLMPQESFTTEALAARLESFLTLPASLSRAAEQARNNGRPAAAGDLAALVLQQASGGISQPVRGGDAEKTVAPISDNHKEAKEAAA